jgi:hypothetical protein
MAHQNLISLSLTTDDYAEIDNHLSQIEQKLTGLIELPLATRRKLMKMGDKSEAFCRGTLGLLEENPDVVPPGLNVPDALQDLSHLDAIRSRTRRVRRLLGRLEDSETALGSDVMAASLAGYAMLKVMGKGSGLEALRGDVSRRFSRSRPVVPDTGVPPADN